MSADEESTRRRTPSGTVHEMADYGVGTMCKRELSEPWKWTDDPVSCKRCLALASSPAPVTDTTEEP